MGEAAFAGLLEPHTCVVTHPPTVTFPVMTTPTQILRRLQQNERLPECSRQRLRLRECGLQGLVACLPEGAVSPQLCQGLFKLFLGAGTTWLGPRGRPSRGVMWIQEPGQVGIGKVLVPRDQG